MEQFNVKSASVLQWLREKLRGDLGPISAGFGTGSPLQAGLTGAGGALADVAPGKSKMLRALAVGLSSAGTNVVVRPIAKSIALATTSALKLPPLPTELINSVLTDLPTGLAQTHVARMGQVASTLADKELRRKGINIP